MKGMFVKFLNVPTLDTKIVYLEPARALIEFNDIHKHKVSTYSKIRNHLKTVEYLDDHALGFGQLPRDFDTEPISAKTFDANFDFFQNRIDADEV